MKTFFENNIKTRFQARKKVWERLSHATTPLLMPTENRQEKRTAFHGSVVSLFIFLIPRN